MMLDRVLALLALLALTAFVAAVPIFVPHADLIILAVGCIVLASYDFWSQLFRRRGD